MAWKFSTNVDEYVDAAWDVLAAEPERNTIGLTVVANARHRAEPHDPPEHFGWWVDDSGAVAGCVSITPPWPLLLLTTPDSSLVPLAQALEDAGIEPTGVNGPTEEAATFAAVWRARAGKSVVLQDAMRLFGLPKLVPSARRPNGSVRVAQQEDIPLIVEWYDAFGEEVNHRGGANTESEVRQRLELGGMWLWVDEHDERTSLVAFSGAVAGVSRVGPVYTPPRHRGLGYAEALTAAVSRHLLAQGQRVVLFTDQSNPTSNAIYQRLGYRPITDRMMLKFVDP